MSIEYLGQIMTTKITAALFEILFSEIPYNKVSRNQLSLLKIHLKKLF